MTPSDTQKTRKKRIFIVDDHPIVRNGLSLLINQEDDLVVCGEASNAEQALSRIGRLRPHLAMVDISLHGSNGIELTKAIRASAPRTAILMLSMHDESLYTERALRAGARGYVMKQEPPETVLEAIREVLSGGLYLSGNMKSRMLRELVDGVPFDESKTGIEKLSDRELEIYELIGRGMATREIAASLGLSVKTVDTHREHIKQKLGLRNATELVHHAIRWMDGEMDGGD